MAKKVKAAASSKLPGPGRTPALPPVSWGGWKMAAILVAAGVLGAGGAFFWQRHSQESSLVRSLPAMPSLSGKPAALVQALKAAEMQIQASPDALAAVAELGRIYHASGYYSEAEACWKLLSAAQPTEAHWPYYLADLSRMAADETQLLSQLEKTVQLAPSYAPAWLELAELEFKTGQLDSAEHAYRERIRLVPSDPYATLGLARLLVQRGQRDEGKRQLTELIRLQPGFPSAHNVYAELLAQEGDVQGAANERWRGTVAGRFRAADDPWKDELRSRCYDPVQLRVWGSVDLQTKRGDLGQASFERAVQLAPEDPLGYQDLGACYLDAGNSARAVEVLERGSKLPRASDLLFISLIDAYRAQRQADQAVRAADRGLALMPGSGNLLNARGLALDAAGRTDEAMAAFRAAATLLPSAPDPVTNLGLMLIRQGRKEEGGAYLKQALQLQPQYAKALTMLARLELEAGNLPDAARYIFPYFEQFPGLGSSRELMSKLYFLRALEAAQRGDETAVEQICRDGLAIVPESAELNGFLGVQYARQNRLPEALAALEKSHRVQPADARVSLPLADVYARLGRPADARSLATETARQAREKGDSATAARCDELLAKLDR